MQKLVDIALASATAVIATAAWHAATPAPMVYLTPNLKSRTLDLNISNCGLGVMRVEDIRYHWSSQDGPKTTDDISDVLKDHFANCSPECGIL